MRVSCEWTFEGGPKAFASRLRRLAAVIRVVYVSTLRKPYFEIGWHRDDSSPRAHFLLALGAFFITRVSDFGKTNVENEYITNSNGDIGYVLQWSAMAYLICCLMQTIIYKLNGEK